MDRGMGSNTGPGGWLTPPTPLSLQRVVDRVQNHRANEGEMRDPRRLEPRTGARLFTLTALINPAAAAEMFRTPFVQSALFLALFMLTDPPTSPSRYPDQLWCGALVAITSGVAQLVGAGQAYLLIGVLAGNVALGRAPLAH